MQTGDVFIISAPSGSGKTTICRKLVERLEDIELAISYTTRPRKNGERDGKDYHFINDDIFDKMVKLNEFLEYASVYGNRYGTARDAVRSIVSRGRDAILEIDVQGGRKVKEALPEAILIAVFPPDWESLERRLSARGRDSADEIGRRLEAAAREIRDLLTYEYIVVNDDLETAVARIECIIRASRQRADRARGAIERTFMARGEEKRWRG